MLGEAECQKNATHVEGLCGICFESSNLLRLCCKENCSAQFCSNCWALHIRSVVDSALYAVPQVKCPGCAGRISTDAWLQHAENGIKERYFQNARAVLSLRCCGIVSVFHERCEPLPGAGEEDACEVLTSASRSQLRILFAQFSEGDQRAEIFLHEVLKFLPEQESSSPTPSQDLVELFTPSRLPALIADPERRVSLQLAFLHRFPMMHTPCCSAPMCFRCKMYGGHPGESCEDVQRREIGHRVCFCPHCGVPTIKSEGCDHMVCVCGRDWTWGVDPLLELLQHGCKADVEPHLRRLDDINARLDGSEFSPVDLFLNYLSTNADAGEIVRLFAKLGARASPQIHFDRLEEAVQSLDMNSFKVLLEGFVGVCQMHLNDALKTLLHAACKKKSELKKDQLAIQATMAAMLIARGASTNSAVESVLDEGMSRNALSRCPEELANVMCLAKSHVPCSVLAEWSVVEHKISREAAVSMFHFRKQRLQARKHRQCTHANTGTKQHRRGGRHKVGECAISERVGSEAYD